ncbi:MAG: response regulator [Actinomycetota bacterium]|nr:response regulator [Actinomycetota bacterium]
MSDDASGTGGPLVLVIEDDRGVRELMVDILSAEGFQVRTAGDGLEGLLKLQVLHPAALVLDIMMPDVGGLRVLDQLASEHAEVPVIVVTGKPAAAAEARQRLGPRNVFDKPFDLAAFVERLREVAETPQQTDSNPPPGEQL